MVCKDETALVGDEILKFGLVLTQPCHSLHSLQIVLQEGEVEPGKLKIGRCQFAVNSTLNRALRLFQLVTEAIGVGEIGIGHWIIGIEFNGLLRLRGRFVEFPDCRGCARGKESVRQRVAGVCLNPELTHTKRLLQTEERRVGKEWRSRWSPYH